MQAHRNPAKPSLIVVGVVLFLGSALLIGMGSRSSASADLADDDVILVEDIAPQSFAFTPTVTIYFPLLTKNHPPFKVPNDTYYASRQWNLPVILKRCIS